MVNVEADVLAGPLLAQKARERGVVYSMAYGDQPALIVELVDWARAAGFHVVAAGKGTKYLPSLSHRDARTTCGRITASRAEAAKRAGMNPQMFNSFLDGTKSALEMAAVANATGLDVPEDGLGFPPCGAEHLPLALRPRAAGGQLAHEGMVEVISSIERDGRPVIGDLRWGVYVVFKATNDYAADCFKQYGLATDPSGRYAAMHRPYHLIGLELSISVLHAALNGQPTGMTREWRGDVVAVAKRALASRRDARRRGRLHRLRQARAGGAQPARAGVADRPCARRAPAPRGAGRRHPQHGGRDARRVRARGARAPRDAGSGGGHACAGAGLTARPGAGLPRAAERLKQPA